MYRAGGVLACLRGGVAIVRPLNMRLGVEAGELEREEEFEDTQWLKKAEPTLLQALARGVRVSNISSRYW